MNRIVNGATRLFRRPWGIHPSKSLWSVGVIALCVGCSKESISVYEVPKEESFAGREAIEPFVPEGWTLVEPSSPFGARLESADGALEMSFMRFNDMSGQEVDTLNIVRSAAGLPPVPSEELDTVSRIVPIGPTFGRMFDIERTAPTPGTTERSRILVALLNRKGVTWFFKLTGPVESVRGKESDFKAFLEGARFTPAPVSESPEPAATESEAKLPEWSVPEGWTAASDSGSMILASFEANGTEGPVAITVSKFGMDPSAPNMIQMNVGRWLGQLGREPIPEAEMESLVDMIEIGDRSARLVSLTDASAPGVEGIVVIWDFVGGSSWFYKAQGPVGSLAEVQSSLIEFVESVRYGNE